jgi:hypothetical protein
MDMRVDPRFEEILDFLEERDENGLPSIRAKMAVKIRAYAQIVEDLRSELAVLESEIGSVQATVDAQALELSEQSGHKAKLITDAQDTALLAEVLESGIGAAKLRKHAQISRERVAEFAMDFEAQSIRLAQAQVSLNSRKRAITDQREAIVRRLNTMSSLASRAGLALGTELVQSPKQARQQPRRVAAPRPVRRRPRRVKIVRRRAS